MKMIQIEIEPNSNIDDAEIRNFMSREQEYHIRKTIYSNEKEEFLVDVVGWQNGSTTQAKAIKVEDSGDGEAWLIYGGNQGLRMRRTNTTHTKLNMQNFSLDNKNEWGELYLYYHKNLFESYIKPFIYIKP